MRPIDADALKELLIETLERIAKMPTMSHEEMHVVAACRMHCEMIDDTPTIDCAPVRRGEWIHDINNLYACSECLMRQTQRMRWRLMNFCPNCGAKMDRGKRDVRITD